MLNGTSYFAYENFACRLLENVGPLFIIMKQQGSCSWMTNEVTENLDQAAVDQLKERERWPF